MAEDQKPELVFPCRWGYKVIGAVEEEVAEAARSCAAECLGAALGDRNMELALSRKSGGGKYVSWNLTVRVTTVPAERDRLFKALADHPAVKMVI